MGFIIIYLCISLLIILLDVFLAVKCFNNKKGLIGKSLGYACFAAAFVQMSYMIAILSDSHRVASIFYSVYFVSIDAALLFLMSFTIKYVKGKIRGVHFAMQLILHTWTIVDIVINIINVAFKEIYMSYDFVDRSIAKYAFSMKPIYYCHLCLAYILIVYIFILLFTRIARVPKDYRRSYWYIIISITGVVILNLIFLIHKSVYLDYSIWGYSIAAASCFWVGFLYSETGFITRLKNSVYDNIDQGIVMFDFEDSLVLINDRAHQLLNVASFDGNIRLGDFMKKCNISMDPKYYDVGYAFQCYVDGKRLKCDYRVMRSKNEETLGRLFMFSDEGHSIDLMTGFNQMGPFRQQVIDNPGLLPSPMTVAVLDINGLTAINKSEGRMAGDIRIKDLAETMRTVFPSGTFFLRGTDANLIALVYGSSDTSMREYIEGVKEKYYGNIAFAISIMEKPEELGEAIEQAEKAMRSKKLLDDQSKHSDILKSLLKSLESCDTDTEDHVVRTQRMGAELGKRIGLTDIELSQLSLLCILHDIGKIAIPIEILNKPGKLTDEEWVIMKSHVNKGYDIAKSSKELESIAEMIKYHHERWDGKGYPDRLVGEQIPLLSRIISVVDTYDAMINDRVYRPALSARVAQEELRRCAGTQFDPNIVKEYLELLALPEYEKETEAQVRMVEKRRAQELERVEKQRELEQEAKKNYLHRVHPVQYSKYLLNASFTIIQVDNNFELFTGYSKQDIAELKLTQQDLIPKEDLDEYMVMTGEMLAKDSMAYFNHLLRCKDGTVISVACFGKKMFDPVSKEERSEIIIAKN